MHVDVREDTTGKASEGFSLNAVVMEQLCEQLLGWAVEEGLTEEVSFELDHEG